MNFFAYLAGKENDVMVAKVVIDSSFGDAGKGSLTNYFCSLFPKDELVLNVKSNGGSQAAHTVVHNGTRHVFSHFGSGSFHQNVDTFLPEDFIVNPIMFEKELLKLRAIGVRPHVYVDSCAPVTLPMDMMINQILEESRGDSRHGSCGLGINETLQRTSQGDMHYRAVLKAGGVSIDLRPRDTSQWKKDIVNLRNTWIPKRLEQLGLSLPIEWQVRLFSDSIIDRYIETVKTFNHEVHYLPGAGDVKRLFDRYNNIIFEGSQGLLLDQNHRFFPHVTHSNTGLKNPLRLAQEAGIGSLDVTYVMRAYMTRHGAGPFPSEVPGLSYEDKTNVPNDWQGTLRFGYLDLDLIGEAIQNDLANAKGSDIKVTANLAVTCLDQIENDIHYVLDGETKIARTQTDFLKIVQNSLGLKVAYGGFGPNVVYKV